MSETQRARLPKPNRPARGGARQAMINAASRFLVTRMPSVAAAIEKKFDTTAPGSMRAARQLNATLLKNNEVMDASGQSADRLGALVDQQNNLLHQIIKELKDQQSQQSNNQGGGGGTGPRPKSRKPPGRGRFGAKARARLERMRARTADARRVNRPPKPSLRERITSLRERVTRPFTPTRPSTPPVDLPSRPVAPRAVTEVPRLASPEIPRTSTLAAPEIPRVAAPSAVPETLRTTTAPTPEVATRIPDTPTPRATPGVAARAGRVAGAALHAIDRILAPTIFLDFERALRDMGDRAEYLPAPRLLQFRRLLTSAQTNVETYNQLVRDLDREQSEQQRQELQQDLDRQQAIIVGQRDRLLEMAADLDARGQEQYQRRQRLAQDQGRTTVGERIVRILPIARYILGDERDTSLEAVRRPTDFKALIERALTGAPIEQEQPSTPVEDELLNVVSNQMIGPGAVVMGKQSITAADPAEREELFTRILGEAVDQDIEYDLINIEADSILFDGEIESPQQSLMATPTSSFDFTSPGGAPPPPSRPTQQTGGGESRRVTNAPAAPQSVDAAAVVSSPVTPMVADDGSTVSTPTAEPVQQATITPGAQQPAVAEQQAAAASNLTFRPGVDRRITPAIAQATQQTQTSSGVALEISSGYRDPQRNAAVGGAGNSAHLRGNAVDVHFEPTVEATTRVIQAASAAGVKGIGVYRPGWLHLDVEAKRVWGPSFSADSIPQWAQQTMVAHMTGRPTNPQAVPVEPQIATAGTLAQQGIQMAAADQQMIRQAGQTSVVIQGQQQQGQQPRVVPPDTDRRGEVPLNIRLEKQVA